MFGCDSLRHRPHRAGEAAPELLGLGDLRAHQLDGDGPVELEVVGVGDQRVGARRHHPHDAVAIAQDTAGEAAPGPVGGSVDAHARRGAEVVFMGAAEAIAGTSTAAAALAGTMVGGARARRRATWPRRRRMRSRRTSSDGDRCRRRGAGSAGAAAARWQRLDKKLLARQPVIAVGLVLMGFALATAVTGDEAADLPPRSRSITPATTPSRSPSRRPSIADLAAGYEGVPDGRRRRDARRSASTRSAAVDVEPGEQVDLPPGAIFEPGNATLTFTPGEEQADRQLRRRRATRSRSSTGSCSTSRRPRPLLHLVVHDGEPRR